MLDILPLPSEYKYFTVEAVDKIENAEIVIVQTNKTSAFEKISKTAKEVHTLDKFFEDAESFDELYENGASFIEELSKNKDCVFCILGAPSTNGFVEHLKGKFKLNFVFDGTAAGEAYYYGSAEFGSSEIYIAADARELESLMPDTSKMLIITGIENNWLMADVKVYLQDYYKDETQILLLNCGVREKVLLKDLSEQTEYGTGASVAVEPQPLLNKKSYCFSDLLEIMKILRSPDGCPWDAEQTHTSLKPYILEESYEVIDAVEKDDMFALYDELGDVLLQVVFHSEIARQCREFNITDVVTAICTKLINRHPHIFGEQSVGSSDEVITNWEEIKRGEKGFESVSQSLRDIPQNMGALMRAAKIQKKAAAAGFDWDTALEALEKVNEETAELKSEISADNSNAIEKEGGDLLFSIVNVLRKCKINPELALKRACEKFITRFSYIENNSKKPLKEMTVSEMDELWGLAKAAEVD